MRLFDEKRQLIKVNDSIIFINRTTNERIFVKVVDLIKFDSFKKLYESFNKIELGYKENESADPLDMEKYYNQAEQEKYGVLAIKITLMSEFLNIDLYTDGACSGNPGPGGWGYVLLCKEKEKYKEMSGYNESTTNNQMELTAVIEGIKAIKKPCCLTIYTDSAYVHSAFTQGWINTWQLNGFKNSQKKEVANKEFWLELIDLISLHKTVNWVKVKGHTDNYYNNLCDKLATDEIKMHKPVI